jgi:hypothetical protein
MANLMSIAEIVDKLIIENIKIFTTREKLHSKDTSDDDYVINENKMNILNENRGTVIRFLDEKINNVINKTDANVHLKNVKTYYHSSKTN